MWLFCDPMDCSPPDSSDRGISQARILEWVAIPFSRGSSDPGIKPTSPALTGRFFTTVPPGKPVIKAVINARCPWSVQSTLSITTITKSLTWDKIVLEIICSDSCPEHKDWLPNLSRGHQEPRAVEGLPQSHTAGLRWEERMLRSSTMSNL